MTFFRDLFGKPAPRGVQETLRALDCSDLLELAGMYGEARECGDLKLMETINERVAAVIKEQEPFVTEAGK